MAPRKRILTAEALAVTMEELRRARQACAKLSADAPIHGPHYRLAAEVMRAIDDFAEAVTGSRDHFHARMAPVTQGPAR